MSAQGSDTLRWNSAGNLANNQYLQDNGQSATEVNCQVLMNAPGKLSNLYVALSVAPGGVVSRTFTVRKNGVATALAVTITGAATTGSDTTDVIAYAAGDLISLVNTQSAPPVNATGIATVSV